ncbi:MAG: hypothetical protein BA862_06815 [Desulfobulbaceae bacterium S3730MH12]|nr:MAG: hypothetical protein BA866_09180 [Desulfobulbaceae bacterium S5133MH15]OEU57297.1 MAG: hypothetical protein BA862_06815 [Desulfobulbaceae bacterium S3730MH12]OEU83924.1 MAG: hypothetical protein BA873_02875 [Desulfobulbaceae bacterium C00003063]
MVEQYTENQYDDDLTVEAGNYEEYDPVGAVDLFEFSYQEESPISRLKSLILSIDWEITDEILIQFNDELVDLKDVWAAEKINLVYIQALEKISKYIYQQKADAHPDAIKLLLTFYYNLEKIVYSEDLTEYKKKDILLKDVKRFEFLKRQITDQGQDNHMFRDEEGRQKKLVDEPTGGNELLALKAIVLGIDWEITDQDLNGLREEVIRLEDEYADSRPRLILLQGIGILGAYIKVKKGDAHAEAFKLLHKFFESLETIVKTPMSLDEEKEILFPTVERFESFKALVGPTLTQDSTYQEKEDDLESSSGEMKDIQPAFADIPEEGTEGFQEDVAARDLGYDDSIDVSSHINNFFGDADPGQTDQRDEAVTVVETDESAGSVSVDSALALEGADVSYDNEDVKEVADETESILMDSEKLEMESPVSADAEPEVELTEPEQDVEPFISADKELALEGVDVETEADDESDEESLPLEESGKLAPALGDNEETSDYSADSFVDPSSEESLTEELSATLDDFFVDEQPVAEVVVDLKADLEEKVDAAVEQQQTAEDIPAAEEPGEDIIEAAASGEESVVDEVIEDADQDLAAAVDPIEALGLYIDSLGLELDDKIIESLSSEIDQLNLLWAAKPMEKSFLQLLSTVTQHIDQHRSESSSESFGLLKSGYDALGALGEDAGKNQNLLLNEISRVVQWQQAMLSARELSAEDSPVGEVAAVEDSVEDVDSDSQVLAEDHSYAETVSSNIDLQKEIAGLRETLQSEIASLRKELKK